MKFWALKKGNKYWDGYVFGTSDHFKPLMEARLFRTRGGAKHWYDLLNALEYENSIQNAPDTHTNQMEFTGTKIIKVEMKEIENEKPRH